MPFYHQFFPYRFFTVHYYHTIKLFCWYYHCVPVCLYLTGSGQFLAFATRSGTHVRTAPVTFAVRFYVDFTACLPTVGPLPTLPLRSIRSRSLLFARCGCACTHALRFSSTFPTKENEAAAGLPTTCGPTTTSCDFYTTVGLGLPPHHPAFIPHTFLLNFLRSFTTTTVAGATPSRDFYLQFGDTCNVCLFSLFIIISAILIYIMVYLSVLCIIYMSLHSPCVLISLYLLRARLLYPYHLVCTFDFSW